LLTASSKFEITNRKFKANCEQVFTVFYLCRKIFIKYNFFVVVANRITEEGINLI
jgi:hypothetical protein